MSAMTTPRSGRLMERKTKNALATEPEIVISANPGCMLQIQTGLRRAGAPNVKVRHIMELLDESYRRAEGARYRVNEE